MSGEGSALNVGPASLAVLSCSRVDLLNTHTHTPTVRVTRALVRQIRYITFINVPLVRKWCEQGRIPPQPRKLDRTHTHTHTVAGYQASHSHFSVSPGSSVKRRILYLLTSILGLLSLKRETAGEGEDEREREGRSGGDQCEIGALSRISGKTTKQDNILPESGGDPLRRMYLCMLLLLFIPLSLPLSLSLSFSLSLSPFRSLSLDRKSVV